MKALIIFLLLMVSPASIQPHLKQGQVYLGSIKDKQGHIIYHVIKHSDTHEQGLQRAHRIDEVVFLNTKWQQVAGYDVGADNLPVTVKNNALYFRYQPDNSPPKWYRELINPALPLPRLLCANPGDCYKKY